MKTPVADQEEHILAILDKIHDIQKDLDLALKDIEEFEKQLNEFEAEYDRLRAEVNLPEDE